jgi:hypothetical protein
VPEFARPVSGKDRVLVKARAQVFARRVSGRDRVLVFVRPVPEKDQVSVAVGVPGPVTAREFVSAP